jgi:nucleotide-binding universal stress UspA family protein
MIKHILVPLDGSELAEAALPAARFLAGSLGATVTLIHVVEHNAPSTVHGERHLKSVEEAEAYLESISPRAGPPGSVIARHVHAAGTSNVVRSIVAHQDELAPDLIVLCTHGTGGIRRILIGSIAQQVAGAGATPVFLIRPGGAARDAAFELKTILIPLDGEPAHERGLDIALELAHATGAAMQLLSIVPTLASLAGRDATMGRFMPGTTQAILQMGESELKAYLVQQATRLKPNGVTVAAEIRSGDVAPAIAESAEKVNAGMIVLATHGRAGNEAFWTNSVASKVQSLTRRPLLLVPIK